MDEKFRNRLLTATDLTIGEVGDVAMEITAQKEADELVDVMVTRHMTLFSQSREKAEKIIRNNFAYYAGYFDHETRERVERLFKSAHPFLGAVKDGVLTPQEIFNIGMKAGETTRDKNKRKLH